MKKNKEVYSNHFFYHKGNYIRMSRRSYPCECKLFIGNVPFDSSQENFSDSFKKYKGFVSADLIVNSNSGESRGFGFVVMDSQDNVKNLLEGPEIWLDGRKLNLTEYTLPEKKSHSIGGRLYLVIERIPENLTRNELKNYFMKYGNVGRHFIFSDINTGSRLTRGFIEMLDEDDYFRLLNIRNVTINNSRVTINKWKANIRKRTPDNSSKFIKLYKHIYSEDQK